tara:strand:- start:1310 stop:2161 length:852 start_codon:yes stop_codon:yes gene_type:complete
MDFEIHKKITIKDILRKARALIPYNEAQIILQGVLKINHAYLISHPDQYITLIQIHKFLSLVKRRAHGEPIAYIQGEREFYSVIFKVNPAVLIPRPETELLVDLALEKISLNTPYKILDLGTGCGIIAISIAKHRPLSCITAIDNSMDAIYVAKKNAKSLDTNNINIFKSNWFDKIKEKKFDLIVSNPPYVALDDPYLDREVLNFEPRLALIAGKDGMECIRKIITTATSHIHAEGWLLLEHGYNQANICRRLLKNAGFSNIFSHPDLSGILRVSGGRYTQNF